MRTPAHGMTHTVTHTQKGPERIKQHRRGYLPRRCCLFDQYSSDLRHKRPHLFRRSFLHLACGVRIGAEGEAWVVVAQHAGDCFDIHAALQSHCCKCVPLRYNYDKPEKPRRIKGFEVFSLIFSSFSKPKNHTEISRIAGGVFSVK